jgi:hypothetical protein
MKLCFPSPEFDEAVAAVCHGSAAEAEMRALNELLRSDAHGRDEYLMRMELHARLASDPDLFAKPASADGDGRTPVIKLDDGRNVLSPNPAVPTTRRRMVPLLAASLPCCRVSSVRLKRTSRWSRTSSHHR